MGQGCRLTKACAAGYFAELPGGLGLVSKRRFHTHLGTDPSAVRSRPNTLYLQPVIRVAVVPIKKVGTATAPIRHEEIEKAVIIVIGPRAACRVAAIIDQAASEDSIKGAVS